MRGHHRIDLDDRFRWQPSVPAGQEPDAAERQERVAEVWETYHAALRTEVDKIRAQFGYCLLLDLHSIRSRVPRLFDGTLPDLILGTNSGTSASPAIRDQARVPVMMRMERPKKLKAKFKEWTERTT